MEKVKVSFVTTVFNEEKSILAFLSSLAHQTKLPDEIVIVDAYSTDNTFDQIKEFVKSNSEMHWKILQKKGNRSIGRNESIRHATYSIIACSDAGCILDKNWLERITRPFAKKSVDVVAGYYHPSAHTPFQKALAAYTCVMPDKLDPEKFLPSSRSIAFRKDAWKKVGGYPEKLDYCEDLVFARNLKRKGFTFVTVLNAIVQWPQKKNFTDAFKQFFHYATGDGEALYIRKNTLFLFIRYIVGLFLLIFYFINHSLIVFLFLVLLIIAYIFWSIQKNYRYVKNLHAFYILPMMQVTADIAVLSGTIVGLGYFLRDRFFQ